MKTSGVPVPNRSNPGARTATIGPDPVSTKIVLTKHLRIAAEMALPELVTDQETLWDPRCSLKSSRGIVPMNDLIPSIVQNPPRHVLHSNPLAESGAGHRHDIGVRNELQSIENVVVGSPVGDVATRN